MKTKKIISQWVRSYYSYKLRLLDKLRDKNLSYLSKNKKKFALQFALKFIINIFYFEEEARWCAFHLVEILSENK